MKNIKGWALAIFLFCTQNTYANFGIHRNGLLALCSKYEALVNEMVQRTAKSKKQTCGETLPAQCMAACLAQGEVVGASPGGMQSVDVGLGIVAFAPANSLYGQNSSEDTLEDRNLRTASELHKKCYQGILSQEGISGVLNGLETWVGEQKDYLYWNTSTPGKSYDQYEKDVRSNSNGIYKRKGGNNPEAVPHAGEK